MGDLTYIDGIGLVPDIPEVIEARLAELYDKVQRAVDWTDDNPKILRVQEIPDNVIDGIRLVAPSIRLLNDLALNKILLRDLNPRQFEEIIEELLRSDGFTTLLGSGTKDGGVDILAYKDIPAIGRITTIWQAKHTKNKVGVSVIRELADVRNCNGANKAVLVTSSFLTRGALERIEFQRQMLHKVDQDGVLKWIARYHIPREVKTE